MLEPVAALMKTSVMVGMQYRGNFLFDALAGLIRAASGVVPILLVYSHTEEIVGWSMAETTLVMGLFLLMNGVQGAVLEPNLGAVVEGVREGTFDLVLMKPLDAQVLVSLSRVDPSRIWDFPAAFVVIGWALWQLPVPGVLDVVLAVVLLLAGFAALYGVWLLAISTAFWFVSVDNLRFLLWAASNAAQWPVTVFTAWIRWILLVAVPVGAVTTLPAIALRGTWSVGWVALGIAVGAGFTLLSRWTWRQALAHYTSASS